jgi:protocatechuate 3,4-dioxygenase beta subunit
VGVPLTLRFTLVDRDCAPLAERAVYVWQCDREARYSLYTAGATDQNYLRGVLATDSAGVVTFTSIFPACYTGRWPHVHFEVYADLEAATTGGTKLVTSQLALPEATCDGVYATRRVRVERGGSGAGEPGVGQRVSRRLRGAARDRDRGHGHERPRGVADDRGLGV